MDHPGCRYYAFPSLRINTHHPELASRLSTIWADILVWTVYAVPVPVLDSLSFFANYGPTTFPRSHTHAFVPPSIVYRYTSRHPRQQTILSIGSNCDPPLYARPTTLESTRTHKEIYHIPAYDIPLDSPNPSVSYLPRMLHGLATTRTQPRFHGSKMARK